MQAEGKSKELAAYSSQTTSLFDGMSNFYLKILHNFWDNT